jgi:hypothetical protein
VPGRLVVVKEDGLPYCRVRRADWEGVAGLEILWQGDGLRAAYDAMIRLNLDIRGATVWTVYSLSGRVRVVRGPAPEGAAVVAVCTAYKEALARARRERRPWEDPDASAAVATLSRRQGARSPAARKRPTKADVAYLRWLETRGGGG